jgi:protein-S-isoprenylcysteine O-methyltransferase Ste14
MRGYAYIILAVGSVSWFVPFLLHRRRSGRPRKLDRRARWGVAVAGVGYALPWYTAYWTRTPEAWRLAMAVACFAAGSALSWGAARALGRHWRIEAGLNTDHELVQHGIYGVVRHPIYTSMFLVVVGTGLILGPLYLLPVSVLLYVVGTFIRVRFEESLLAERFGEEFWEYRRGVGAYVPMLGRRKRASEKPRA